MNLVYPLDGLLVIYLTHLILKVIIIQLCSIYVVINFLHSIPSPDPKLLLCADET